MDTDSFIVFIKTDDIYKGIAGIARFDPSNYELEKSLPKVKNKKVTGLIKDKLGGKIMTKLVGLRAKTYHYLKDDANEDKKGTRHKKVCHKKKIKFEKLFLNLKIIKAI